MADGILTTRNMLIPILILFRICDCDPKKKGPIIFRTLNYIFLYANLFWTIFIVIKLVNGKDSLAVVSNTYISYILTTQILIKAYQLNFHAEKLSQMLDVYCEDLWPSDVIIGETNKYDKWHKMILRSIKTYRAILCCCIVFIMASPFLNRTRTLPIEIWFFGLEDSLHESPLYEILYLTQIFSVGLPYITYLIAFDMLFIAMVGSTNIQFDMLKQKFLMIGNEKVEEEEEYFEKLKAAIKHHNIILTFVNDIQDYFSLPLLKQYVDAVTCMGVYIYLALQDFHFLYLFSLMTNMSQTLLYSLCGQIIQDKSLDVADAAFESGWENIKNRQVRQGLTLVIQRAHRKVKISAGGIIDFSFETFIGMLKAAFSFLTVLRSTGTIND